MMLDCVLKTGVLLLVRSDACPPRQMALVAKKSVAAVTAPPASEVQWEADSLTVDGVNVRAATLPALVRLLVDAFGDDGSLVCSQDRLPLVVLLMHRWFTKSEDLADQLMVLYQSARTHASCNAPSCLHCHMDACPLFRFQARVCYVIRYWIIHFPMQFDLECDLSSCLKEFQSRLTPSLAELVDQSQVPSYDWMRHVSVRNNNIESLQVSLVLNQLEPMKLAEHITYLEHKVIRRVCFHDYKRYAETGSLRETPRLEHSVALFNGLTQWIQCMVLSHTTAQERANVIAKFIDVAQNLLELQNYNSLMAVVGSVSHSVLARLSKTMSCVPPHSNKVLADLTELLSSSNNFGNYRRTLENSKGFKIPILGVHLKDIISLHVALPDMVQGHMVNVRKMAQLSLIFHKLDELQKSAPPVEANMDLVNTLRLSLDLAYTDDEIYELSLAREPRNSNSCSPTQATVFAEWVAGPSPPPHPQTIEKHVNAMVEAVFKNYDTDRDGYISHEEFDAVAGNFPFIASFGMLDLDHDGVISQDEMRKYFIQANYHALKSGFRHDFHETTYFKPTFCLYCAGLLWGLIRQGYKCRDCGINAHKHCKDLVVLECHCRSRSATNAGSGESSSNSANARRKFRRKKKSSSSDPDSAIASSKCSSSSSSTFNDSEVSYSPLDCAGGSLPPSPQLVAPRRKVSESLLVPSLNRAASRLRTQNSCPESCFNASAKAQAAMDNCLDNRCNCHVDRMVTREQKMAAAQGALDLWQSSVS